MSNKPRIYGNCIAGCRWETVHKEDFLKACSLIKINADTDGRWQLSIGEQYKIKSENVADVGYGFSITFKYNDNKTAKEFNFAIPSDDKYANYVVFKLLDVIANATEITLVYEIAGIRYSQLIGGMSLSLLDKDFLYIKNAEEVFIYNPDASYYVYGDGSAGDMANYYTKAETDALIQSKIESIQIGGYKIDQVVLDDETCELHITSTDYVPKYTLTLEKSESGSFTGLTILNEISAEYSEGEEVVITATKDSVLLTFDGWYEGDTLISTQLSFTYTMPNRDVVLTAKATSSSQAGGRVE